MGICRDKSMTYLADRGYNVVRHPSTEYKPLMLLGRQNGETLTLGALDALITKPPGPLPQIGPDQVATDLNGNTSSKLALGLGLNILGNIIGAMGGNLGAKFNFSNAKSVEFTYSAVLTNSIVPIAVGNYLRAAEVDAGNLVLREYVLGNGELFLITKIAKSNSFTVKFADSSETGVEVDVPTIQGVVGGNVKVEGSGQKSSVLTFSGPAQLVFAFQCFQVGVLDGFLSLTSVKAGAVAAATLEGEGEPSLLQPTQLISIRR
jgi:hypothetical protein